MIQASQIARFLGVELLGPDRVVKRPAPLTEAEPGALCFSQRISLDDVASERWKSAIVLTAHRVLDDTLTHMCVPNPRLAFAKVVHQFFRNPFSDEPISPQATIAPCVKMGSGCRVKAGAVLGLDGFGFERDESGVPIRLPHIGGVVLGQHVEVGANTVIARGTMSDTVIGDHVKLDDLVFIAHNAKIGARTMVVANAEISGSVSIGEDSWVGPGACIRDNVTIGHNALIGMGAVVVEDVGPYAVVCGNPARVLRYNK